MLSVVRSRSRGRKPLLIWTLQTPSSYKNVLPVHFRTRNPSPLPPAATGHVHDGRTRPPRRRVQSQPATCPCRPPPPPGPSPRPPGERVWVRGTGQHRCEKLPSPRPSPGKGEGENGAHVNDRVHGLGRLKIIHPAAYHADNSPRR